MYNREKRPFVNPKAVELRSTRMSIRKRRQLSKQKEAEETDASIEQPETSLDTNIDSPSGKTSDNESLQHRRQQTSALREQRQMNTPQRQRSTTPWQQQKQDYSPQRTRSSSRQNSEIVEQKIRKAGGRVPFSLSDENELYEFLLNQAKYLRGNKIYKQLAKQNPRHTAQSWRDHALEKYVDKPYFIKEWNRKWFPSNNEKEGKGVARGGTTIKVTKRGPEVARINKEREVNRNKEQINEEESSDYNLDLESDDAAAEALILGQEKGHVEEEDEEQPPTEEDVDSQQNENNYSDSSEVNVGIGDEYLPIDNELNESSDDCSVSEDSEVEDGLPISGKTGRTSNKIQRQDTLDFDVGPKQKGKRIRQDSEEEDEDTLEQQRNTTPSLTPIRQLKEFSYNEQKFLMDINRLVNETRRPKEICELALEMSTYHYDTARELLLFGIRSEIHSRIWTDEEDELLLKYQEDLNHLDNLNNIIDKHSIELTKERLYYLKKRNEKSIKTKRRKVK